MKNLTLKLRNVLVACLFVLMTLCIAATAFSGFTALGENQSIVKMRGASVRISSTTAGEYGLRFGTLIEKSKLDAIEKADDFEVGMLYIPSDLVDGALTVDTATVGLMVLTDNAVEETVNGTEYYSYRGYIKNMPAAEYDRVISARSYIKNNGVYTYAETIERSALSVARADYNATEDNQTVIEELYFTPYTKAKIECHGGTATLNSDNTLQVGVSHYSENGINYTKTLDTYGSGTYIMTEFVGQNMIPTIFFGVNDIGTLSGLTTKNDYTNIGLTGVGIFAGVQNAGTKYVYRATATETATVSASVKIYYNYGYLKTKNSAYEGSTTACDKTHVLVIGAENVMGGVNIEHMLFEKDTTTGALTLIEEKTQLVSGATLDKGNILFGSATNVGINANFKLYTPDTRTGIIEKLAEVYNYNIPTMSASDFVFSEGSSVTVTVSDNETANTAADDYYSINLPSTNAKKTHYAKTVETYAPGTYIMSEFVGANMIPTIFFGVTDIGSVESTTANDYLNMGFTGVGIFAGVNARQPYYVYRATTTETATGIAGSLYKYNYGYLVTNNTGWYGESATGNSGKTFVLLMGANNVTDGANIDYSLFEKDTTTGKLTIVETKTQLISGAVLGEGSILFGSATNASNQAKFKLYKPDTKENLLDVLSEVYGYDEISSASFEFSLGTHSVTDVEEGKVQINMSVSGTDYNYAKTVKKYEAGTYALLEFTGANAPRNIFFGSTQAAFEGKVWNDAHTSGYFTTGINGFCLCAESNFGTTAYTYVNGERVVADSSTSALGKFDRGYLYGWNVNVFTEAENSDEWRAKNYVMIVGAVQDGANVKIEYTLYLNAEGSLTEIQTKDFIFKNQTLEKGSIVFTPSTNNVVNAIFNLYTPDTKENIQSKFESVYGEYLKEGEE